MARVRLEGSCDGCPSSTMTLKLAIEEAVQKAAPDLEGVEAEGVTEPPNRRRPSWPDPTLRRKEEAAGGERGLPGRRSVGCPSSRGRDAGKEISGEPVLFLKLADDFYAYRTSAPAAEIAGGGGLSGGGSHLSGCGRRYDARRAGRSLDDSAVAPGAHPAARERGARGETGRGRRSTVKVALPSAVG